MPAVHRFFVSPECINGDAVTLPGAVSRQLARVLRSRPGDRIVVLDGSGWEHAVTLKSVSAGVVRGIVTERSAGRAEPSTRIVLYQAVLKADRFEFVLQKCTELGVTKFVPFCCARSVPRMGASWEGRYARWRRITTKAAEQSHRARVPALEEPVEFSSACDRVEGPAIIPWEEEGATGLKAALAEWKASGPYGAEISVFIGPEGGFTPEEIDLARVKGIAPVSLGNRILRAETAAIVTVGAVLYELDELGG